MQDAASGGGQVQGRINPLHSNARTSFREPFMADTPIDLYSWPTPNGHKVHIALEEMALPYTVHPVDILAGDQFEADYLALNPNNKMPTIVDPDGPGGSPYTVFESGAILLYLAEKTGKFMPQDTAGRYDVIQWLMWQMGGVGPMFGQRHHFHDYAPEKLPYAIDRYTKEAHRLYNVLDRRLAGREFICGDYTIADMAAFPWCRLYERHDVDAADIPNVKAWIDRMHERPGVARGLEVLQEKRRDITKDKGGMENLFGDSQYTKR